MLGQPINSNHITRNSQGQAPMIQELFYLLPLHLPQQQKEIQTGILYSMQAMREWDNIISYMQKWSLYEFRHGLIIRMRIRLQYNSPIAPIDNEAAQLKRLFQQYWIVVSPKKNEHKLFADILIDYNADHKISLFSVMRMPNPSFKSNLISQQLKAIIKISHSKISFKEREGIYIRGRGQAVAQQIQPMLKQIETLKIRSNSGRIFRWHSAGQKWPLTLEKHVSQNSIVEIECEQDEIYYVDSKKLNHLEHSRIRLAGIASIVLGLIIIVVVIWIVIKKRQKNDKKDQLTQSNQAVQLQEHINYQPPNLPQ